MKQLLQDIAQQTPDFVELRYHRQELNSMSVTRSRTESAHHQCLEGVAIRVYHQGHWGFSTTADLSKRSLFEAVARARESAQVQAQFYHHRTPFLRDENRVYKGNYIHDGYHSLKATPFSEKMATIMDLEQQAAKSSTKIHTASCRYDELIEDKIIITSDGACASLKIARPTLYMRCFAQDKDKEASAETSAGITGSWKELFQHPTLTNMTDTTAQRAVELLNAPYAESGVFPVILSPSLVGLLCHEAIGHTVEADFVKAGSVAQNRIGTKVASELVTLKDTGTPHSQAAGFLPCDDEGFTTTETTLIDKGQLASYLHNRTSAAEYGTPPTGNARAFSYTDEPMIRMTNTYLEAGQTSFEDMISGIEFGYLAQGDGGGEADSNGEFQFGCGWLWEIKKGKKNRLIREANLSGIAFDVLQSVDAVGNDFQWDMGSGYCYKGQRAKVDAGGPHIRCRMHVGGRS